MNQKLMSILLVCTVVFSIFLTACSKEKAEEYTVDELGALIEETQRIFETKTKDLTEDELYSDIDLHLYTDTGIKIYKECCEYTGLPYDTEIIVSGLKKQFFGGIQLYSNDTEYDVGCYFPQEPNSNLGIFVEDGDEVTIKGRITDSPDNLGVIRDIEFI